MTAGRQKHRRLHLLAADLRRRAGLLDTAERDEHLLLPCLLGYIVAGRIPQEQHVLEHVASAFSMIALYAADLLPDDPRRLTLADLQRAHSASWSRDELAFDWVLSDDGPVRQRPELPPAFLPIADALESLCPTPEYTPTIDPDSIDWSLA